MSAGPDDVGDTGADTAMHSGSDAGAPGDRPLLDETEPEGDFPEESDAAARAAADDAPLPADGGPQDDGLEPEFSAPER
jgi:hypothetical protein